METRTGIKRQTTTKDAPAAAGGAEWFAAFLPKATLSRDPPAQPPTDVQVEPRATVSLAAVREEIEAISGHLTDPSADGVRAAIPHLERAIEALSNQTASIRSGVSYPAVPMQGIDALRSELARANRLFDHAYELHAVWATQLGIHLDGTPRQLFYTRPGKDL
jgi:hypothetical protein